MDRDNRIRILLADDHPIMREGLAAIIGRQPDMEVVGEAADGREAVEAYALFQPDVMLMDLRMPQIDGAEALVQIRSRFPNAQVIMLTIYHTEDDVFRCMNAGAKAFLLKGIPQQRLIAAIRRVSAGGMDISAEIGARLAARLNHPELTRRENEVLQVLATGKSNLEIAGALGISEGTVKAHVNNILSKMNVADRTQAVIEAIKRGSVVL